MEMARVRIIVGVCVCAWRDQGAKNPSREESQTGEEEEYLSGGGREPRGGEMVRKPC